MSVETVLAELYSDPESIRRVAHEANVDLTRVAFAPRAADTWHAIIQEAERQSRTAALAAIAVREYPNYAPLQLALAESVPSAIVPPDPIPVRVGRLEQRVDGHELTLRRILEMIDPGPRRRTAMALFWGILVTLWSSWLIVDIRVWYLSNPVQAVGISLAAIVAALVVRWLPEADHGDGS